MEYVAAEGTTFLLDISLGVEQRCEHFYGKFVTRAVSVLLDNDEISELASRHIKPTRHEIQRARIHF